MVGLWSQKNPTPPWEYRHPKKQNTSVATDHKNRTGAYHGNFKSRVFHSSECENYNCKNCTVVFKTREDAIKAGYKPCGKCRP